MEDTKNKLSRQQQWQLIYRRALKNLRDYMYEDANMKVSSLIYALTVYAQRHATKDYCVNLLNTEFGFTDDNSDYAGSACGNQVVLDSTIFRDKDLLIQDINTIFHELRHVAQFSNKPRDDIELNNINYSLFLSIVPAYEASLDSTQDIDLCFDTKYHSFVNSLYLKDEMEIDARGFALDLTHTLLEQVSKNLTFKQQIMYKEYRKQLQELIENEELDVLTSEANEQYNANDFIADTKHIRKTIVKGAPLKRLMRELYSEKPKRKVVEENMFVLEGLIQTLAFAYDARLARDIYNKIYNSKSSASIKLYFINYLLCNTDFLLADEDLNNINKMCKENNGTYPLENLVKQKPYIKGIVDNTFKANANQPITQNEDDDEEIKE